MFERRSLKLPIALGVTLIVLIVLLIVGWVLITVFAAVGSGQGAGFYWGLLPAGTVLLAVVLLGVVMYLSLSIKAINLSRRQANFIDSVTHELKSPLASLKLYLQTLKRQELDAEQRENFRRIMLDDVERLDHMIDHLLDAGRHQVQSSGEKQETATEISDLIAKCVDTESRRYHLDESTVTVNVERCYVMGSRSDLHVMFRNLIDNAIKYAGTPPQIRIESVPAPKGKAIVRIEDNGRGIPLRERRKIFHRFVRLGLELERDRQGTGLGLFIVRNLVRQLGGGIRIKDPQKGQGTVFEVTLTAADSEEIENQSNSPSETTNSSEEPVSS